MHTSYSSSSMQYYAIVGISYSYVCTYIYYTSYL